MSAFTPIELTQFETEELRIAGLRDDGTLRKPVIIWMVVHEGQLYVRSVNGPDAAWFRGTQVQGRGHVSAGDVEKDVVFTRVDDVDDELDEVYLDKYRSYPSAAVAITTPLARSTTLRVDPA